MFSSSLRSSLVALVASAIAVSAAPGLTVWTSTFNPDVQGLENLKVTTTIANTGDETLKLLNDPRGILDSFPENSFSITDAAGSQPSFVGAKVKFVPEQAASLNEPGVFTVLAPGASIDVTHYLSSAYDFTMSGPGQYSIEPSNLFTYVDADGSLKDLHAIVKDAAEVNLSGTLAVSHVHDQRTGYVGCSADRERFISYAVSSAQTYARNAHAYLSGIDSPGTVRYIAWFGTYVAARKNTVQNHFRLISSRKFSDITYDCTCTRPNVYAYVYPNRPGRIYLCNLFWPARTTGSDSQAGTLVHEASHFTINGGTDDYVYGWRRAMDLADRNPARAIMNADNHEYFAENTPYRDIDDSGEPTPYYPGDLPPGALHMQ